VNPIIHDYLTQIMVKHYRQAPEVAAQQASKLLEIFELYGMQLIVGDWVVPEKIVIRMSPFDMMMETTRETMEREPWNAPELKN
jgi:hypothetical protein